MSDLFIYLFLAFTWEYITQKSVKYGLLLLEISQGSEHLAGLSR